MTLTKEIFAPTNCPSCNSELEWTKDMLFCRNPSCATKLGKAVEHFAKTLKIKGLGPVTIRKLNLSYVDEIYELTEYRIASCLSSERLAEKLIHEIKNSEKADLNRLLPAFAIPLVGKSASGKLATVCTHIYDIDEDSCREAGLGAKTTRNLLDWIKSNSLLINELPFSFKFEKPRLTGNMGIVCISGRLKSYKTKAEATQVLTKLGYTVKASLTKDVQILINEGGVESAKTKRARESGVAIIENLKDFIGEI
jgi:NAD-dependent DNA ligase